MYSLYYKSQQNTKSPTSKLQEIILLSFNLITPPQTKHNPQLHGVPIPSPLIKILFPSLLFKPPSHILQRPFLLHCTMRAIIISRYRLDGFWPPMHTVTRIPLNCWVEADIDILLAMPTFVDVFFWGAHCVWLGMDRDRMREGGCFLMWLVWFVCEGIFRRDVGERRMGGRYL